MSVVTVAKRRLSEKIEAEVARDHGEIALMR